MAVGSNLYTQAWNETSRMILNPIVEYWTLICLLVIVRLALNQANIKFSHGLSM